MAAEWAYRALRKICTWNFSYVIYQHAKTHTHTHADTPLHTQAHRHTRRAEKLQIDVSKCGTKNGAKNFRVSFLAVLNEGPRPHPPPHCSNGCILLRIILQRHSNSNNINKNFKVFALGHVPAAASWIFSIFVEGRREGDWRLEASSERS